MLAVAAVAGEKPQWGSQALQQIRAIAGRAPQSALPFFHLFHQLPPLLAVCRGNGESDPAWLGQPSRVSRLSVDDGFLFVMSRCEDPALMRTCLHTILRANVDSRHAGQASRRGPMSRITSTPYDT